MRGQNLLLLSGFCGLFLCYSFINQHSEEIQTREQLGKKLFFDPILSGDKTISCASCHKPEFAFADNAAFSNGVNGQKTGRNTPSAMNMAGRSIFFLDGRAATLEEQALGPIQNPGEMNLPVTQAIERLKNDKEYSSLFKKIFNAEPNEKNLGLAIASFERTLETSESRFDKYINGDKKMLTSEEIRGHKIFVEKAGCFDCHFGVDFTADEFRNIGLYNEAELKDKGRFEITKKPEDIGKFKVPGLRNIAVTAPYMHNGMFNTLEEVVDYYNEPTRFVKGSINTDSLMKRPVKLNEQEKKELVAFLKTLTDAHFEKK